MTQFFDERSAAESTTKTRPSSRAPAESYGGSPNKSTTDKVVTQYEGYSVEKSTLKSGAVLVDNTVVNQPSAESQKVGVSIPAKFHGGKDIGAKSELASVYFPHKPKSVPIDTTGSGHHAEATACGEEHKNPKTGKPDTGVSAPELCRDRRCTRRGHCHWGQKPLFGRERRVREQAVKDYRQGVSNGAEGSGPGAVKPNPPNKPAGIKRNYWCRELLVSKCEICLAGGKHNHGKADSYELLSDLYHPKIIDQEPETLVDEVIERFESAVEDRPPTKAELQRYCADLATAHNNDRPPTKNEDVPVPTETHGPAQENNITFPTTVKTTQKKKKAAPTQTTLKIEKALVCRPEVEHACERMGKAARYSIVPDLPTLLGGNRGFYTKEEKIKLARAGCPFWEYGADPRDFSRHDVEQMRLNTSVHAFTSVRYGKHFTFKGHPWLEREIVSVLNIPYAVVCHDPKMLENFLSTVSDGIQGIATSTTTPQEPLLEQTTTVSEPAPFATTVASPATVVVATKPVVTTNAATTTVASPATTVVVTKPVVVPNATTTTVAAPATTIAAPTTDPTPSAPSAVTPAFADQLRLQSTWHAQKHESQVQDPIPSAPTAAKLAFADQLRLQSAWQAQRRERQIPDPIVDTDTATLPIPSPKHPAHRVLRSWLKRLRDKRRLSEASLDVSAVPLVAPIPFRELQRMKEHEERQLLLAAPALAEPAIAHAPPAAQDEAMPAAAATPAVTAVTPDPAPAPPAAPQAVATASAPAPVAAAAPPLPPPPLNPLPAVAPPVPLPPHDIEADEKELAEAAEIATRAKLELIKHEAEWTATHRVTLFIDVQGTIHEGKMTCGKRLKNLLLRFVMCCCCGRRKIKMRRNDKDVKNKSNDKTKFKTSKSMRVKFCCCFKTRVAEAKTKHYHNYEYDHSREAEIYTKMYEIIHTHAKLYGRRGLDGTGAVMPSLVKYMETVLAKNHPEELALMLERPNVYTDTLIHCVNQFRIRAIDVRSALSNTPTFRMLPTSDSSPLLQQERELR
jgi:hypothetical protein